METNEVDAGRTGSSSMEGGCRAGGPSQKAAGKKNWNAAVLIFVILLTGAVGAHSLLTMNRCRAGKGTCPGSSVLANWLGGAGREDAGCPSDTKCPAADMVMSETDGCPLRADANKPCAGRGNATTPGCCPGAGFGWADK